MPQVAMCRHVIHSIRELQRYYTGTCFDFPITGLKNSIHIFVLRFSLDIIQLFYIQITDNQDRFLYGNSSFEKIMGFSQADLLDTNLWELQSPVGLSELVLAENEEYESVRPFDHSYMAQIFNMFCS